MMRRELQYNMDKAWEKQRSKAMLIGGSILVIAMCMLPLPLDMYASSTKRTQEDTNVVAVTLVSSQQVDLSELTDQQFTTSVKLTAGSQLTVVSQEEMAGIYIEWDCVVPTWIMQIGDNSYTYGENGYIHEYVVFPERAKEITITIPDSSSLGNIPGTVTNGARIAEITAFREGEIPSWVQIWQPPLEEADLMIVSAHGDDEHLFFGSVIPYYEGELGFAVQVVYFTQHWDWAKLREHEKLNGLWVAGNRHYPINGYFQDIYSETLEGASNHYSREDTKSFLEEVFLRCAPQVVLTHDLEGEYGHGAHIFLTDVLLESVQNIPKVYVHLYEQQKVVIDCQVPLDAFGGMTMLEVSRLAYLEHASQQWCNFSVEDTGKYSIGDFGLIHSLVGEDVEKNDFMENIISYQEQHRIEEDARIQAELASAELAAEQYAAEAMAEEEAILEAESEANMQEGISLPGGIVNSEETKQPIWLFYLVAGMGIIVILMIIYLYKNKKKKYNLKE